MQKIEKKLNEWSRNNLLNSEQVKKILEFERKQPSSSWVLYGSLALGAVIIVMGVVSLIAANWEHIPSSVKLGVDFIVLASVGYLSWDAYSKEKWLLYELLLLSQMGLVLASIGLIAQIYHLDGALYETGYFWCSITLGLALMARQRFVPWIWVTAFFVSTALFVFDSTLVREVFKNNELLLPMILSLGFLSIAVVLRRLQNLAHFIWSWRFYTLFTFLFALIAVELEGVLESAPKVFSNLYFAGYGFAWINLLGAWFAKEYSRVQKVLVSGILVFFVAVFHIRFLGFSSELARELVHGIATIVSLFLVGIFAISLPERRMFYAVLALIGARVFGIYLQAFGGLTNTGLGLILSGLLVIGLSLLWNKYKKPLAEYTERILNS
jgi:uncharacterized membrane protein